MNAKNNSVLIVDDNQDIRNGIKYLMNAIFKTTTIDCAENGLLAINKLEQKQYDIVLMDISMPVMNGITATKIIRKQFPEVKLIIMSMHNDGKYITASINHGTHGYILKENIAKELKQAIQTVTNGEKHFSSEIQDKVAQVNEMG